MLLLGNKLDALPRLDKSLLPLLPLEVVLVLVLVGSVVLQVEHWRKRAPTSHRPYTHPTALPQRPLLQQAVESAAAV